jgi:flavodoxin
MKSLVAYYSRRGENYVGGDIVDLPVGNTEVVAGIIQKLTGSEIFRIDTVAAYPLDYQKATEVAKEEFQKQERPELAGHVADMNSYDVIFLGFPNWWGTMPMAVFSFLEEHDLSGKTIVPFCTHEGSGTGHSENDIKKTCPSATVLKALPIQGSRAQKSEHEVLAWLTKAGVIERGKR